MQKTSKEYPKIIWSTEQRGFFIDLYDDGTLTIECDRHFTELPRDVTQGMVSAHLVGLKL